MAGTKKPKYETLVYNKLESMEVGDTFMKKDFILENWGVYDYFIDRSFSVFLTRVRKKLPERQFKTIEKFIIRLE